MTSSFSVLMSPVEFLRNPLCWLRAISDYRGEICATPNFALDLCVRKVREEALAHLDLSSWKVALIGAEPVRADTLERFARHFAGCGFQPEVFYPCYGLAEATLFVSGGDRARAPIVQTVDDHALQQGRVSAADPGDHGARSFVSCGRAHLDQKIVIVDPETGIHCSGERVGEIWVSGPSVATGYWNDPEATEETFGARLADTGEGPFLRTGDLGFLREDGELFITGRIKDLIIIRGRNHYPQDIELSVVQSNPAAFRPGCCAVFSIDVEEEERLVVVQELARSRSADQGQGIPAHAPVRNLVQPGRRPRPRGDLSGRGRSHPGRVRHPFHPLDQQAVETVSGRAAARVPGLAEKRKE